MRGTVILFDSNNNTGIITGEDGGRYYFSRDEWRNNIQPYNGARVDFRPNHDRADEIIAMANSSNQDSPKDWLVTLLLCIFLGEFGIHRFYTGQIGIGILQLITAGGCGIWWLIDIILIVTSSYRDHEGRPLVKRY